MALAMSPVRAAAILLPVLVVQDVVGVWAFRRDWDSAVLRATLPGAAVGVLLGYLLAAVVSVGAVLGVTGGIAILFGLYRLHRRYRPGLPARMPDRAGPLFGLASGFTSQIAHAGVPPFQLFVLPRGLSPTRFAGTGAIFFAAVNWMKVPAFLSLGQFTAANLGATLVLMPVAIAATFGGVRLVRRVTADRFYLLIDLLMIAVGLRLLWSAFSPAN